MIEALIAALGTTAGKAAAGLAIASASVGGLAATDAVELPGLSDTPAEVTTDDQGESPELPTESQTGQDAAEAGADNADVAEDQADVEAKKAAAAERKAEGQANGQDDVDTGESQGIGEAVSGAASEGEGPARDRVLPLTPGGDHAAEPGAPEDAGERQDATVRPEQSYQGEDGGEAEAEEESDLDDDQGEPAGSAATGDENRGGTAAAGARP